MALNPNGYYTPGNPKRKREVSWEWYKRAWNKAFTQDEVIAKIRALSNKDYLTLMNQIAPKTIENKGELGMQVTFVLNGVRETKSIQGQIEHKAINPPTGDDGDDAA